MGKFKKFWCVIFCLIAVVVCITPSITVFADDPEFEPEYVTPDGDLDDMFELTVSDLTSGDAIVDWLTDKHDFIVLEDNEWQYQAWINVPNLQLLIFGKLDGVFACGYTGSGTDLDMATATSMFPTDKNANTAMYQYGFSIPSITYKGEYPVIEYQLSEVLPHGVWGTIKSAIRALFGQSIIEAPDTDAFSTLNYVNLTDYYEDYAMCCWIQDYWEDTCDEIDEDQGLLPKSICGNKESKADGKHYTAESCIFDNDFDDPSSLGFDLDNLDDCVRFNRLLKTTYGQYYSPVMTSIIYYSDGGEGSQLTQFTCRRMPYYAAGLDPDEQGSIDFDLVEDPRCDADAYFNIVHQKDPGSWGHTWRPFVLNLFGKLSQLTWFIDQLTKFDKLEDSGLEINILWNIGILKTISTLFLIFLVISMCKFAIRTARGHMSPKEGILKSLCGIVVAIIVITLAYHPGNSYEWFKSIMEAPRNIAGNMFASDDTTTSLISSSATSDEKYDMSYWVPYFEMWTYYNTNHNTADLDAQTIDIYSANDKEMKDMTYKGYIGSEENGRWDLLLAHSFCSGSEVKRDAYRVVDHFLAPKFDIDFDNEEITTTENKYFTGDIQSQVGYNWMIIVDLFIMECVKVFLFMNACINFAFFVIFIIFRYKEEGLAPIAKGFAWSILMYTVATILVPVVASFTYYGDSDALKCFFLSFFFLLCQFGFWRWNKRCPDWMRPMILVSLEQKKWRK